MPGWIGDAGPGAVIDSIKQGCGIELPTTTTSAGSDPRTAYGDLAARGIRGMVLEAFGTGGWVAGMRVQEYRVARLQQAVADQNRWPAGNMPDLREAGWLPWLRAQRKKGVIVYLSSQCRVGRCTRSSTGAAAWRSSWGQRQGRR